MILVDHGSKRGEANDMLLEFANLYRCATAVALGAVTASYGRGACILPACYWRVDCCLLRNPQLACM